MCKVEYTTQLYFKNYDVFDTKKKLDISHSIIDM